MKKREWQKHKLSEVADLCLGKMLDKKKNKGELHPYLGNIHVRWGRFNFEDLPEMRFEKHEHDRYGLKYGDLVVCEGGEPGRCALWKEQVPGMKIQKALHRVRPHKSLDGNYLLYWFLHAGQLNYFDQYTTGATIKHLPGEKLAKIEIDLPDLPTQKKIAGILSAYDDLIENNLRRIAILEEMAQSLYREWFVHFRFPGHEAIKLVDSELGKIPEGWEVKSLQEVCIPKNGIQTGPFGSQLHKADYTAEGIPVVMPKDLFSARISTSTIARVPEVVGQKLSRHRLEPGDIVYGRRGDIGRRAYVTEGQAGWLCGTGSLRLRPNLDSINGHYLFAFLGAPSTIEAIKGRAIGATMLNLSSKALSPLPILIPTALVQSKFTRFLESNYRSRAVLDSQNENLRKTRDLLLPKLLS